MGLSPGALKEEFEELYEEADDESESESLVTWVSESETEQIYFRLSDLNIT